MVIQVSDGDIRRLNIACSTLLVGEFNSPSVASLLFIPLSIIVLQIQVQILRKLQTSFSRLSL